MRQRMAATTPFLVAGFAAFGFSTAISPAAMAGAAGDAAKTHHAARPAAHAMMHRRYLAERVFLRGVPAYGARARQGNRRRNLQPPDQRLPE
jgi:hypothetical protein